MNDLTFRILNKNDYRTLKKLGKIFAKKRIDKEKTVREALMQAGPHIQNGSFKESCFISTSTSITTVIEHYTVPHINSVKTRPFLAVIKDLINNSKNIDIDSKIKDIKAQIVINLSDNKNIGEAVEEKLFISKTGKLFKNNKEGWKPTPGTKYAKKSREVLILNEIDEKNILTILNPVAMDVVYTIAKYNENIGNDSFSLYEFITEELPKLYKEESYLTPTELTELELELYDDLYRKDKFMCDIVDDIYKNNNNSSSLDILEVYSSLKNHKRNIISELLKKLGYELPYIPIPEDSIHIIRKGECISPQNYYVYKNRINYINFKSFDPNAEFELSHSSYTYIYDYNNSDELYTLSNKNAVDIITDKIDEKLGLDIKKMKFRK